MRKLYFLFIFGSLLLIFSMRFTHSYFTDASVSGVNTFATAASFPNTTPSITITVTLTPTETPTITPTPSIDETQVATTGAIVINEVYYDVGSDKGEEGNSINPDEWIELYNPTNSSINIKNWSIGDATDEDNVSNSNRIIPPGGFALISKNNSTWSLWDEDSNALLIPLGDRIGEGLANNGDIVILKDAAGNTIDMVSWGSNTTAFNPSVSLFGDGHSLERNPVGKDTNSSSDFVDRSLPTPGS